MLAMPVVVSERRSSERVKYPVLRSASLVGKSETARTLQSSRRLTAAEVSRLEEESRVEEEDQPTELRRSPAAMSSLHASPPSRKTSEFVCPPRRYSLHPSHQYFMTNETAQVPPPIPFCQPSQARVEASEWFGDHANRN